MPKKTFQEVMKIITNGDIFWNMSGADANIIENFEWNHGRLERAWNNHDIRPKEFWNEISRATDICDDDKFEIQEYGCQILLLFKIRDLIKTQESED